MTDSGSTGAGDTAGAEAGEEDGPSVESGEADGAEESGPGSSDTGGSTDTGDADTGGDDPCAGDPCAGDHVSCEAVGDEASCVCDAGFHEEEGLCVPDLECMPSTCNGHGDCTADPGGLSCDCETGFSGDRCDACNTAAGFFPDGQGGCTTTPCDPNPCVEPGRGLCTATATGPTCECDPGTHDDNGLCVPDEMCGPNTCNGHGQCADDDTGVRCTCDEGYAGAACNECELPDWHPDGLGGCTQDPCVPNPCDGPNRSVCLAEPGGTTCECDAGYHDEGGTCVVDEECEPDTCNGHGTCSVVDGFAVCDCDRDYVGPECGSCDLAGGAHDDGMGGCTTDPCLPNPCTDPNKGECSDVMGAPVCSCDVGYHDDGIGGCTMDPCMPDPCAASNRACRDDGMGDAECYTPDCDDGNPCTDDALVMGVCEFTTRMDGSPCSTSICESGETCSAGVCGGGTPVVCDDGNPCTQDECIDPSGCSASNDDALVPDDGIACTIDSCAGGVAANVPDDGACDDTLWCNGTETCVPADGDAGPDGCLAGAPPSPPGPSYPCRSYGACDDDSDSFPLTELGDGDPCDDGIACTTGDACAGQGGACVGTPKGGCPAASCTSTVAFPDPVDLPTANLVGAVTLDGAALPGTVPAGQAYDITIYALAKDTGTRQALHYVRYRYDGSGNPYALMAGDDALSTRVVPGIYDILYRRGTITGTNDPGRTAGDDTFAHGYRLLQTDVVLGPGDNTLNIDLPTADLSGAVTLDGAALPATVPAGSAYDITLYAKSQDTGVRQTLHYVRYRYDGSGNPYALMAGDDAIDTRLVPGTYDILYRRGTISGTNDPGRTAAADSFANGYRLLQTDVVITSGANVVDVDLPTADLTGAVTLDGAALPATVPAGSAYDITLYLRSQDTQVRQAIHYVRYRYDGSGNPYALLAGDDAIATRVVPGTYDVLYRRGTITSTNDPGRTAPADAFANGYRLLQTDVVIGSGAVVLDVDLPTGDITGAVTLDGAALPATVPAGSAYDITLYALSQDTGVRQIIHYVRYRYDGSGNPYALIAGDDAIATRMVPGTYDILYRRGTITGTNDPGRTDAADAFANGYRVLQTDVVVTAGANAIPVDLPTADLGGSVTLDGAPLPATVPAGSAYDITLYLRSQDTGVRQAIHYVRYRYDASGNPYALMAGDDTVSTRVVPGSYDLLYRRGVITGTNDPGRSDPADAFANGYRLLLTDVTVTSGSNVLDIDLPTTDLTADVTLNTDALPLTVPAGSAYDITLYAQSRDMETRQVLHYVRYRYDGSGNPYALMSGDDLLDTRLVPGEYDLIYRRGTISGTNDPGRTDPSDVYAHGYRVLDACLLVE